MLLILKSIKWRAACQPACLRRYEDCLSRLIAIREAKTVRLQRTKRTTFWYTAVEAAGSHIVGVSHMTASALMKPRKIRVNRTELRNQQSRYLQEASGNNIVEVIGRAEEGEKYVVDKEYLNGVLDSLRSAIETINIIKDPQLFAQIMRAAGTIDEDIRLGKLHSFEEAFGEE